MITVISGDLGSGKSLGAMQGMEFGASAGRMIATNIRLTKACPFESRTLLLDDDQNIFPVLLEDKRSKYGYRAFWHFVPVIPQGWDIWIDEADSYFDCTDHSALGRDMRLMLKMSRKFNWNLFFIVQSSANLYVRIRRLAQRFVVHENTLRTNKLLRTGLFPKSWARFIRSEFSAYPPSIQNHSGDGYLTYKEAARYFGWFKTEQLIGNTEWMEDLRTKKGTTDAGVD